MNKFFFKLFLLFSANILFSFNNNNSLSSSNTYTISVSASSSSSYTLSGNDRNGSVSGDDPDLTFKVGDVVTFSVNASGHPFYLKTVAGTGTGNQIDVNNNGTTSGDIVWTPSAKGTFFYQCSLHSGMVGTITIKDPQIWQGDNITFTKGDQSDPTLQANQDRITDNVWITRANKTQDGSNGYGQIFNIKEETKPDVNNSPLGTKWAIGTIDQIESLTFKKFRAAVGKPKDVPGKDLVVYLEKDDIYLSLKFSSWSQGQKGGFSYERSTQTSANNTPVATAQSVTTQEDTAKEITHAGTDADEDTLSFIIVTLPTNGSLKDGDTQISSEDLPKTLSSAKVTYTPNSDYNGDDSYTFKVNDGTEDSSSATVSITVSAVNDAPVATDQSVTTEENTAKEITHAGTDADKDTLSFIVVTLPTNGSLKDGDTQISSEDLPKTLSSAKVTYTPNSDYNGDDSYTFKVNDGTEDSSSATVSITVSAVNEAPVATAQSVTTEENTAKEITHAGTDADEDTLSFIIVTLPTNGTLKDGDTQISSENLPKTLTSAKATYTPNSDYNGDDSYTFKVNDGTKDSEKATISITVTSNDLDDDGVKNPVDKCPDTPAGAQVDFDGCQVFSLPVDNNKVSVTSATCIGTSDGSIGLSVEDASYDYTITVTDNDNVTITGDSKTGSVTGLAAGTYNVCFKVDSQASYEQCFDVVIGEPAALSAYLDIDNDNRTTSIQLGGSSSYNIDINGTKYDVSGDSFIATLPTGLSIIKISTDLDCQGVIEREVFLSEDILYYPNPTQDDVNVHVDGQDTKVTVSVFSEKGSLLYREEQEIKDMSRLTQIDLSKQITGTYIVVMEGPTVRKTFKIVKR